MKIKYIGNLLFISVITFIFLSNSLLPRPALAQTYSCTGCEYQCDAQVNEWTLFEAPPGTVRGTDPTGICDRLYAANCDGIDDIPRAQVRVPASGCIEVGAESAAGECECCNGSPPGEYDTAEECANNCAALGGLRSFNGDTSGSSCTEQPNQEGAVPPTIQQLENPLGTTDVSELIGRVIKALLGIVGSIGLLMFVYGGFTWMTAGGNEKRVEQGKQILTWAVIGLVTIFSAYAILSFIIDKLTNVAAGS